MSTFLARVEDYVGTVSDTTGINDWLTSEARTVMRNMDNDILRDYAKRAYTSTSAGWSVRGKKVLLVRRGDQECDRIKEDLKERVTNSDSMHYATQRTPVYYTEVTATDTRLYVKPDPAAPALADITYIDYPSLITTNDPDSLANFPSEAADAVTIGTARRVLQKRMDDARADEDLEMMQIIQVEYDRLTKHYVEQLQMLQEKKDVTETLDA